MTPTQILDELQSWIDLKRLDPAPSDELLDELEDFIVNTLLEDEA